ncbi:MAG: hypothetical protein O0X96_05765 [Methanocorpusculum sp.]|nr:hypothetical protein [Methanocorpusculum sp.]
MAEGRMAYGWIAMLIIIFVVSVTYILFDPAIKTMYEAGIQLNPDLVGVMDYLNLLWTWFPLAFILALLVWGINMGIGNSPRPDRIVLGWLLIIVCLFAILAAYVSLDSIVTMLIDWGYQINTTFGGALSTIRIMWYNYPYPVTIAVIIWAFIQSVSSESNSYYYNQYE